MTEQTLKDIDRAFKALEEKDELLDKLRAEINQYGSICVQYRVKIKGNTDKDVDNIIEDVLRQAKQQVLAIIDKYIGKESE